MPNQCLILHQWAVFHKFHELLPIFLRPFVVQRCTPSPSFPPLIFSPHQIALGVHFPFGARSLAE